MQLGAAHRWTLVGSESVDIAAAFGWAAKKFRTAAMYALSFRQNADSGWDGRLGAALVSARLSEAASALLLCNRLEV
jgi:hypothetical protein